MISHADYVHPFTVKAMAVVVAAVHVLLVWQLLQTGITTAAIGQGSSPIFASVIPAQAKAPAPARSIPPVEEVKKPQAEPQETKPVPPKAAPTIKAPRNIVKKKIIAAQRPQETPAAPVAPPDAGSAQAEQPRQEPAPASVGSAAPPSAGATSAPGAERNQAHGGGDSSGQPASVAVSALRFKKAQKPDYPEQSRIRNESGDVSVLVVVNTDGMVEEARIKESCGHALLDNAALKAARRSRFHPHMENGISRPVITVIPYHFSLNNE